jgi:hypothetical protein
MDGETFVVIEAYSQASMQWPVRTSHGQILNLVRVAFPSCALKGYCS